ncbi:MAG: phosphate ABC transporter substrate-binding protein [gamma proteobacterium symbiont of Ctena orbiculata]|uniref:Phosphate ABC transporter substrate-binding protein n=1 Tax=Candidatus Thiodiazotropha taylori TaxID=2792791 RepID=A0A944ME52_9GAMM|nr:phosphate ABC transporter substrate-binding protein [Candidatus Thiodiazotropha taylori]PUB89514.1 MAG: phosphate ABC transporter substrate-binding protein [gamma proteobacterium symbiont of Ctena orbiculata]MBT2990999.1 phosphate ABC transporter substrate-binding protein [Candidatus Thiodiazotropha taylori]MBT2997784.1 phosphate ABC transporter substrate-binding protein [Candidatus Thiodiazotropha taylori]MBT3000447.1 phosphate ABC transporter substrate-binding protein [Candidatus Thiodiazo
MFLAVLSSSAQALELSWVGCGITRNAFMADLAAAYAEKTGVNISIAGGGATKGIRAITGKQADIGGACRFTLDMSREEAGAHMVPVAWDALVVVVHKSNPIESISLQQLRSLYQGKITNWSQLGGKNRPVELLIRKGKISGVGYTLRQHLFEDQDVDFKSKHLFPSSGPLEKAVEQNPNAISVTGVASAHKRDFKILKLEGRDPNFENIRTGNYLLYRPLYLVHSKTSPNSLESDRFIRFALGPKGREIIRNNQVVPYFDGMLLLQKRMDDWKLFIRESLAKQ